MLRVARIVIYTRSMHRKIILHVTRPRASFVHALAKLATVIYLLINAKVRGEFKYRCSSQQLYTSAFRNYKPDELFSSSKFYYMMLQN